MVDGDGVDSAILPMVGVTVVVEDGVQAVGVVVDYTNQRFQKTIKPSNPKQNRREKQPKRKQKRTKPQNKHKRMKSQRTKRRTKVIVDVHHKQTTRQIAKLKRDAVVEAQDLWDFLSMEDSEVTVVC